MKYLFIFVIYVALDFVWAKYTKATASDSKGLWPAIVASNWASMLPVMGGLGAIVFIEDHWALVPVALGSWVGTFISVFNRAR